MKRKLNLIFGCGIFLLIFHPLFAQSAPKYPNGVVLFELSANGELAQALCFQKTFASFSEVLFKGPSGVKIRVVETKDDNFFGYTTEFIHVATRIAFKSTLSTIFFEQNLPIPVIYTMNGVVIAGIGDNGPREKELVAAVQKEFAKLPMEFQQGLREFYLYCNKSIIGLAGMAATLNCIFGKQVEPSPVDKMINTNHFDIQAFEDEFKGN